MTEKELLRKRERKARRRKERKRELTKPENREKLLLKELKHLENISTGIAQLNNLRARAEDVHDQRMAELSDRGT